MEIDFPLLSIKTAPGTVISSGPGPNCAICPLTFSEGRSMIVRILSLACPSTTTIMEPNEYMPAPLPTEIVSSSNGITFCDMSTSLSRELSPECPQDTASTGNTISKILLKNLIFSTSFYNITFNYSNSRFLHPFIIHLYRTTEFPYRSFKFKISFKTDLPFRHHPRS